ncbi:MAG: polyprenyl synthetase family protein [Planctomycetota bacterium]
MTLSVFLDDARERVNRELDRLLPSSEVEPRRLHEAMRYAIFAGGKRLRPAIALAACRAVGANASGSGGDADAFIAGCALEMLHTYSLIHDDLPAIDDDDLRRGRPTCHKAFDEATAILAGDALQTDAFRVLAEEIGRSEAIVPLVRELAVAAGTQGMVGGEIADIEAEGADPEVERTEWIHRRKTAALFRASAVMGGIVGGADADSLAALAAYGTALGLAFQIVDDILDETQDAETLGKSPGKDRMARKMTYPAAVGLDGSRDHARTWAHRAKEALSGVSAPGREAAGFLVELADMTVERSR